MAQLETVGVEKQRTLKESRRRKVHGWDIVGVWQHLWIGNTSKPSEA